MADFQKTGAILTPSQREFLRGNIDEEASDAKMRMKRRRITDRIQASLVDDIPLIIGALASDNKPNSLSGEKIVDDIHQPNFRQNLSLLVALAVYLSRKHGVDPDDVISEGKETELKSRSQKLREKAQKNPGSMTLDELMEIQDDVALQLISENISEDEVIVSPDEVLEDDESDRE